MLRTSLLDAALGATAGIGIAFVLAVALALYPPPARVIMPFAFLSQTMPLVALTPLIARGRVAHWRAVLARAPTSP